MTETLTEVRAIEMIAAEYKAALETLRLASVARAEGERELERSEAYAQGRALELRYELLCAAVGERPKPWPERDPSSEALR